MASPRRGLPRAGRSVLLALPYLLLVGTLVPVTVTGTLEVVGPFLGLMQLVGLILTVVAARWTQDRAARPWWLLSLSWLLLAVTTLGFTLSGFAGGRPSDPTSALFVVSMIVRVLFGLVLFAGLVSFGRHLHGRARWRLLTDAATLTGAGLMVMWFFLLGPALSDHQSVGMARVVTVFLPISDLTLVLGTVVVLLSGSNLTTRRAMLLLLGGVTCYLLLDSLLVAETLYGSHFGIPPRLEIFCLDLPSFLFAAAAAEHCRTLTGRGIQVSAAALPPVTWLPQGGLVGGFTLLAAVATSSGLYPWPGLIAGAIIMTLGVAVRQSLAVRENRQLAFTDVLTRLPNRGRFIDELARTLDTSYRTGVAAAVMLIDLDEFKPINDRYGHEAGDEVLVAFAGILRRTLRRDDCCARLGGDEFAVIVRDVRGGDEAGECARGLLDALAATPVQVGGLTLTLRASIGVAVTDPGGPAVDGATVLRRADEAMYVAKRARTTGWWLWTAGTAKEAHTGPTTTSQAVRYAPVHDGAGRVVAVHVDPGPLPSGADDAGAGLDRWQAAATQLNRWRTGSPTHRDLKLYVTAGPDSCASLAALHDLAGAGIRPTDVIIDVGPLVPGTDQATIDAVQGLRSDGALTAVDAMDPHLGRVVHGPGLPVDLVLIGHRIIGENAGSAEPVNLMEAAVRFGQAVHRGPDDRWPGPADAIDALLLGDEEGPTGTGLPSPRRPEPARPAVR